MRYPGLSRHRPGLAADYVVPFFTFPPTIRKMVYTSDAVESLHGLRKIIKTRGSSPATGGQLLLPGHPEHWRVSEYDGKLAHCLRPFKRSSPAYARFPGSGWMRSASPAQAFRIQLIAKTTQRGRREPLQVNRDGDEEGLDAQPRNLAGTSLALISSP